MLHDHRTAVYLVALAFEASGLVLIVWPDVAPDLRTIATRVGRQVRSGWWRVISWSRRALRRPARHVAETLHVTGKANLSVRADVIRGEVKGTIAEKVAVLIERDRWKQEQLNRLEASVIETTAAHERQIEDLRTDLTQLIEVESQRAVDRHRRQRAIGTALVAIGAVIGTLGNLA